ncbi:MAG: sulfatase-like hydrolase/transferase [Pirellulaceae bacterium]
MKSLALAIAVGVLVAAPTVGAAELPRRPNILFVFTDDQRWDTIGALGNSEVRTPHLDQLVRDGYHFTNAYCMGSMIGAVCLPSRTMLITGRSLWRIPDNPRAATAPAGVPLLPQLLNDAGYVTFHHGKAGNACTFGNAAFTHNFPSKGHTIEAATEHANRTIEFLQQHDGQRPFFVYLAPPVPHDPRIAPERFHQMYPPDKITLPRNFMPEHPFDNGELRVRDELLAEHPRQPDAMRQHLSDYYAVCSQIDEEVGRILQVVRERGWDQNTIVIYSSDQGLAVGGRHGLMGKQNLYEHVKPPLIFYGPGIPAGHSDALVYLFDLFPTICELAGVTPPDVVEGKSLLPVVHGKRTRVRDWLFGAYRDCQRMVRDERWKLLEYDAGGERHTQLFDLSMDPDELNNLVDDRMHAGQLARMRDLMTVARKFYSDPVDFGQSSPAAAPSKPKAKTKANANKRAKGKQK